MSSVSLPCSPAARPPAKPGRREQEARRGVRNRGGSEVGRRHCPSTGRTRAPASRAGLCALRAARLLPPPPALPPPPLPPLPPGPSLPPPPLSYPPCPHLSLSLSHPLATRLSALAGQCPRRVTGHQEQVAPVSQRRCSCDRRGGGGAAERGLLRGRRGASFPSPWERSHPNSQP